MKVFETKETIKEIRYRVAEKLSRIVAWTELDPFFLPDWTMVEAGPYDVYLRAPKVNLYMKMDETSSLTPEVSKCIHGNVYLFRPSLHSSGTRPKQSWA